MADKKTKGAGNRFLPGSNIAKHREWRGLKDTWYDYTEWVKVLGVMGGFVAKSPVRIMRGMLTYRWMGSYLAALNMIDRCVEGLRGPALRVARLYLNTIMKGSTTSIAEMKSDAVVLNMARGGIVNEQDLYVALTTGQIRAAASDVFVHEPPACDDPLIHLDNFIATFHIGGSTYESLERVSNRAVDYVFAYTGVPEQKEVIGS